MKYLKFKIQVKIDVLLQFKKNKIYPTQNSWGATFVPLQQLVLFFSASDMKYSPQFTEWGSSLYKDFMNNL